MNGVAAISGPHSAKIRPLRAVLLGIDGKRVAAITIVVDDTVPEVVMHRGKPFLLVMTGELHHLAGRHPLRDINGDTTYRQVRPFRYDGGE